MVSDKKRFPIRERIELKPAASGTNNLETDKVDPGKIQVIQKITAENKTSNFTELRIGVLRAGQFFPLIEWDIPTADTLYDYSEEVYLIEGECIRAEFTGVTAGDHLVLDYHGYWYEIKSSQKKEGVK